MALLLLSLEYRVMILPLQIISDYIDDVEALGEISATSKHEIGRVLARNRSL